MNPHPINEIDRVVIQLPDDAMFYRDRRYLPVIIDLVDGARQPALLSRTVASLPHRHAPDRPRASRPSRSRALNP